MIFSKVGNLILNFIYPPKCIFCRTLLPLDATEFICPNCKKDYKGLKKELCCKRCGKPVPSLGRKQLCYNCLTETHFYYKRIISAFSYDGSVKSSLMRYKDYPTNKYSQIYAKYLFDIFQKEYSDINFDFIAAVPADKNKSFRRTFDPVTLLCNDFSALSKIPFEKNVLWKTRKTQKQSNLSYSERQTNLLNSIKADSKKAEGKTVLLIDDVCTTIATVSECSKALKRAGAKNVYAITLCTTLKNKIIGKDYNK